MGRKRTNFFIPFEAAQELKGGLIVGDEFEVFEDLNADIGRYVILKIHPRKGGVTARRVPDAS